MRDFPMATLDEARHSRISAWRAWKSKALSQSELYRVLLALRETWGQALYGDSGLR